MIITPTLIVLLLVVFVLLFLFINTIDKRKWLTTLVSLVLTPFAYFFVFYPLINIVSNYHHQKYLDSESWKEKPALRYEMVDYIIESDTLIGKTKPQLQHILGKAEWLTWNDSLKTHDDNKWNYGLGILPGAFTTEKSNIEITFKDNKTYSLKTYTEPIQFDEN